MLWGQTPGCLLRGLRAILCRAPPLTHGHWCWPAFVVAAAVATAHCHQSETPCSLRWPLDMYICAGQPCQLLGAWHCLWCLRTWACMCPQCCLVYPLLIFMPCYPIWSHLQNPHSKTKFKNWASFLTQMIKIFVVVLHTDLFYELFYKQLFFKIPCLNKGKFIILFWNAFVKLRVTPFPKHAYSYILVLRGPLDLIEPLGFSSPLHNLCFIKEIINCLHKSSKLQNKVPRVWYRYANYTQMVILPYCLES